MQWTEGLAAEFSGISNQLFPSFPFRYICKTYSMLQPSSIQDLSITGSSGSTSCNQMKNKGMDVVPMLQREERFYLFYDNCTDDP